MTSVLTGDHHREIPAKNLPPDRASRALSQYMNDVPRLHLIPELDDAPAVSRPVLLSDFGDVLTIEEAASVLRIGRASAYEAARRWRRTRSEGLPVIEIGRRLLVPRAALERLLDQADPSVAPR